MKTKRFHWGVFLIVNGCSQECEYDGTNRDCVRYVRRQRKANPSKQYLIIPI